MTAAETLGAKGRRGGLAPFSKCIDRQSNRFDLSQVMLLKKYGFQNKEMVTIPWTLMGDPSFSSWKPQDMDRV